MILLIDNYDSFSYNLYQLIGAVEPDIQVIRNDVLSVDEVAALSPQAIVLSPGPGRPADAGICEEVVQRLGDSIPIFGVCLGHQAIVEASGGIVGYASTLMHGKQSECIRTGESTILAELPETFLVGRYHSLAAAPDALPDTLRVTARSIDGEVMAVEAIGRPVFGVQFHPESIMTPDGAVMIENFINLARRFEDESTKPS